MKTALFIVVLLVLIGVGVELLYKLGEVIVELQDTMCHGEHGRLRREHGTEENNDGSSH